MSAVKKVAISVLLVAIAAVAVALGFWQLRRLAQRRAANHAFLAASTLAPIDLPSALASGAAIDSGRRIIAHGRFDRSRQVLLRGRVYDDAPGLEVVTLFRFDSSASAIWVLRGFVRSPDAVTPPDSIEPPDTGRVALAGEALAVPITADSGHPLLHDGVTTWERLDRNTLDRLEPGSLPVYLLLAGDSTGPGRLATIPPEPLSNGPHLSYAIQWFGIAAATLAFGAIVLWRDDKRGAARLPVP